MALWTINPNQDHDVNTIVYLLKDALRSALSDAWFFERTALPKADLKGADHAEIAAKLGRFRDRCRSLQEREALMLTKILRARAWAAELRRLAPSFQLDIGQFQDETEPCEEIKAGFLKDAQQIFNGGSSLARFLSEREPGAGGETQDGHPVRDGHYLVGGRKALYELRSACEVFLSQIDDEFFSTSQDAVHEPAPALVQTPEEPAPLLLTDSLN